MKSKTETTLRLSSGDYADEISIRDRAQTYFLSTLRRVTPEPLYSLREDVFPSYEKALESEKANGRTEAEVEKLAYDALVHILLRNDLEVLREWAASWLQPDPPQLFCKAAADLIAWSQRFNLTGCRRRVREDETDPLCLDLAYSRAWNASLWPLMRAMETILVWYSSPKGKARMLEEPPQWNQRFTMKGSVGRPQSITPIDLAEVAWNIDWEPEEEFRERTTKSFKAWLDQYIAAEKIQAESIGHLKAPEKRRSEHFEWAARYQIKHESAATIANALKGYNVSPEAVRNAIERVLSLIQLQKRSGRGRKPQD